MILLHKIRRQNLTENPETISRRYALPIRIDFPKLIPTDLFIDILSRLPPKSVARCRCVSKLWQSTLLLPNFTDSFFARSVSLPQVLFSCQKDGTLFFFSAPSPDAESLFVTAVNHMNFPLASPKFEFCGSVHGLVCVMQCRIITQRFGEKCEVSPVMFNTSAGQVLFSLPDVVTKKTRMFRVKSFFGYDPVEKQFKILSMNRSMIGRVSRAHQVLTLGDETPSWRMVDGSMNHNPLSTKVCIDGVMYYVGEVKRPPWVCVIVCFDVRSEKFRFIEGGEGMLLSKSSTLVNYKGKLGALLSDGFVESWFHIVCGGTRSLEMRVLEDPEKGVWSRSVYELPTTWKSVVGDAKLYFVGVACVTNEIVLAPRCISDPFYVFYYDIDRKTVRKVGIGGMDAFQDCKVHISVDHIEDVKLRETFCTYNLNI